MKNRRNCDTAIIHAIINQTDLQSMTINIVDFYCRHRSCVCVYSDETLLKRLNRKMIPQIKYNFFRCLKLTAYNVTCVRWLLGRLYVPIRKRKTNEFNQARQMHWRLKSKSLYFQLK